MNKWLTIGIVVVLGALALLYGGAEFALDNFTLIK